MKIVFVGGGASNIFASILCKKQHPEMEVLIIEKSGDLGRKLSLTGNGKCNLAPMNDSDYSKKYNQANFVKKLYLEINDQDYLKVLEDIGIKCKYLDGKGLYPFSESTKNVLSILKRQIEELGIKVLYEQVVDYEKGIIVKTDKQNIRCDYLVLGSGGKSYPKTGSDGNMFDVLERHGYKVEKLNPSLCPVKVKENVHDLFGSRCKGTVSLISNGKVISSEAGEIMFKKDGLSGICVMNLSRFVNGQNYELSLNLLKGQNFEISHQEFMSLSSEVGALLSSLLPLPIVKYLIRRFSLKEGQPINNKEKEELYKLLSDLRFSIKSLYDYDEAQVTRGGVSIKDIREDFSSILEENVYLLGEMLDVDGPCGGYNLRFAITSAIKCISSLK